MTVSAMALFGALFFLLACASPEATRTRGGGPGADVGNRTRIVQMHEGSKPFDKTPQIIRTQQPTLTTASKDDRSSRK
jgi:hypothetical protein